MLFIKYTLTFFTLLTGLVLVESAVSSASNKKENYDYYGFSYDRSIKPEDEDDLEENCNDKFKKQKEATGTKVSQWKRGNEINVDELGEYPGGDVLYPPKTNLSKNGVSDPNLLWPNAVVPTVIHSSVGESDFQRILEGIGYYHEYTCVRFVQRQSQTDYILIGTSDSGCYTERIGRTGGRNRVNLQSPECLQQIGVVLHELMHAIGYYHEHVRWNRDDFVNVYYENMEDDPVTRYQFQKIPRDQTNDQGVRYDYASVMHYGTHAGTKNGKPTMLPKADVEIGQRRFFSEGDLTKINRMYGCV